LQNGGYRYGFNGKEDDGDFGSGQLIQDYGFRLYNPTIGKFLSVDPLTASYPWYTPYQFAGNMPLWKIDLDGLEEADSDANRESPVMSKNFMYRRGKVGDRIAMWASGVLSLSPIQLPTRNQAANFADAVDGRLELFTYQKTVESVFGGQTTYNETGYKVVLNENSQLWIAIKSKLEEHGIDINSLSTDELKELQEFKWEQNQDRSDLFTINTNAPKLARVALLFLPPYTMATPIVLPPDATASSLSDVYVDLDAVVDEQLKSILLARKPKNTLPEGKNGDLGPINGKLERRNPQTGELLQERWYDENGLPTKDIDYDHDHGAGKPHMHEWYYPSPQAPNKTRGEAKPISNKN
jgi:RHS repeat-associated protein